MFFHVDILFSPPPSSLKSRMKWLKDEMLLDMINKLQTGVNVRGYTHTGWPTVIDYSQCDATRHITMLIQSALTWCAMSEKRERVQTITTVWVWGGERDQMNGCASVWSQRVCVHACLSQWAACNTKAAATLVSLCSHNTACHRNDIWKHPRRGRKTKQSVGGFVDG